MTDPPQNPDNAVVFRCLDCDHRFEVPADTLDWERCPQCGQHVAIAWQQRGHALNTLYWDDRKDP